MQNFELFKNKSGSESGESLGKLIAESIGVGIDENSYLAITAMENVYVELETLTKNYAKNAEKLAKKRREREVDNLKNMLKLELISEQEYYETLRAYRDKNLRQGSDEWYKYTEEIILYNKRMKDEVLKLQTELGNKLKMDDEPWFSQSKVKFKGLGIRGTDLKYTKSTLDNFEDEIGLMKQYEDALLKLKAIKNLPDGVIADIGKMDVKSGLLAAQTILGASENERESFIKGYISRNNLAQSLATELNPILNAEKLKELGISSAEQFNIGYFSEESSGSTAFLNQLEKSFESVPESYFTLGESSADSFGEGFVNKIPSVMENARNVISASMKSILNEVKSSLNDAIGGGSGGDFRTYNNTYTFNSSKDTTTEQLRTAKNAATLMRLRGGND